MSYLEHANITVPDVEDAARFLQTLDPAFEIRHAGVGDDGLRWMHIGTQTSYFALRDVPPANSSEAPVHDMYRIGVNHLGVVVKDIEAVAARLRTAGYEELSPGEAHPHRARAYFLDGAGFEWELIEYFSDDPAKRNDYEN